MTAAPPGQPAVVTDGRWRRPSWRSLLVTPLRTMRELIPTLFPIVLVALSQGGRAYWLLLLLIVLPVALTLLRWWTTGYRLTQDTFEVRHGIVRKHRLTAQLERIRTVDEEASLLRRAVGIVDLRVGTGAHEAVSVHGIDAATAGQLHRALLARRRTPSSATSGPAASDPAAGASTDVPGSSAALGVTVGEGHPAGLAEAPEASGAATTPDRTIAAFRPSWLRFAPFTMSGVATALTAWAIAARIVNELRLGDAVVPWVQRVQAATDEMGVAVLVVEVLLGALVAVSVLALTAYALANWNYRLTRRCGDATLHVRRGLLTSRATTIEERRLRGLIVERPLLLRIPRGARAKALVTGGRHTEHGSARATNLLVPPAPEVIVTAAAADVLGTADPLRVGLVRHGPRATRRRYSRALFWLWPWAAAVLIAAWWWSWPRSTYLLALLVLTFVPVLGALRARWLGHALLGDPSVLDGATAGYVVASSGAFPTGRTALRSRAVIGWVLRESWFQRRAGLVTLEATVATPGGRVQILDVPRSRAVQIVCWATPGLADRYVEGR